MIGFSKYTKSGVAHRWTPAVERDWEDMMHANCGLTVRRVHLKRCSPNVLRRCEKCFRPTEQNAEGIDK